MKKGANMPRYGTLLLLLVALLSAVCHGSEHRLLEPEEWGNLRRYPFFQESAPGWYGLEAHCRAYGAVGKGYAAMIHEGATQRVLTTTLERPLPAGKYKVFISSMGLIWSDQPNVVAVRVGAAQSRVEWTRKASKFTWYEGSVIELAEPAAHVELEVLQFGGKGFAMLYDPASRCIPIDQVYITSDLNATTGPSHLTAAGTQQDRDAQGEAASASEAFRAVNDLATPEPVALPRVELIRLASFDGSENLLPNSSFELGGGDGWSNANNSRNQATHIFTQADHVADAVHGHYALRLPGKGLPNGLQFSRVFHVASDGVYTLSGYMKALEGQKPTARIAIVPLDTKRKLVEAAISAGGQLTGEYQRFTGAGELKAGPVLLAVYGACLLDAVQLELGEQASDFKPRALVEASLSTDQLGHILYSNQPVKLTAWAHNAGAADTEAVLRYRIVDVREQIVAESEVRVAAPAGQTVSQDVVIEPSMRGQFNVVYAAQGRPMAEGELIYSVLPPLPQGMPRHALASNMDNDPASLELMQRMGHKWQLYCKLYVDQPQQLNPKPDDFFWERARAMLTLPKTYGMQTMPALWPNQVPAHLQDLRRSQWDAYGSGLRDMVRFIKNGKPVLFPDLDAWREHCRRVAQNLGDTAYWWTIHDETEMYYSPREFAQIARATSEGFKASGKEVRLSLSCMGDYTEEVIAELDGQVPLAGLGSSSYDYEYWEARKVRYLQQRYGVPWACIGVGVAKSPQFRRTAPFGEPAFGRAVATAQEMVLLAIAQDAKIIGHYTGRLWFDGAMANKDYPLMDYDGTPLVHGYAYSAIPLLVADAEPIEDILLPELGTMVFVYRQAGRLHAVTWANNTPHLDIHWETDPRIWHDVTLVSASGPLAEKVIVADMFGNDRSQRSADDPRRVKSERGAMVFDLDEEPTFLINRGLSDDDFLAMVRGITASPRPIDMRMAFLPDGRGGIDLGVWARNNTGGELRALKLDANFPPNRMLNRTEWTLPRRDGVIGDIPVGGQVWGRIATRIGPNFPVENATYTTWITQPDGSEHRMVDTCWLTVAPALKATIDGQLDEWEKVHPAWMYYTYSWGRFGRHNVQFQAGGEHFKYVHRIDARAAIYAGHHDQHLYLAIRCQDDDPIFAGDAADVLEITLNGEAGALAGSRTLELRPRGPAVDVTWRDGQGPAVVGAMTQSTAADDFGGHKVWTIELAIPLAAVKFSGKEAIGFDVVWHDADHDGNQIFTGTWRWAGRSTGLGTLVLGQ